MTLTVGLAALVLQALPAKVMAAVISEPRQLRDFEQVTG